ncbi:hypothetical protein Misp01_09910 [Microtetraspora sp. NBRC 13810]|nr:hypothetical protein Misp01_09910 [Microtetraspora sp. NBRC 13810]
MDSSDARYRGRGDAHDERNETVVLRDGSRPLRSLRHRQRALLVVCLGAFITAVDGSAVYVALPSIQADLGFTPADLAWVVNAYLIPFGGLLLFAGRLGDVIGPRRVFMAGIGVFVAASLLCALADNAAMLLIGRAVQGAGGALISGVALSLIITLFPKAQEQGLALSLFGFVSASAAASGLLIGAGLTALVGWELIFLVNLPIGAVTILGAMRLIDDTKGARGQSRVGAFDTLLLVAGVALLVYSIVRVSAEGWDQVSTLVLAGVALLLLAAFAVRQVRTAAPLIPPASLRARNLSQINLTLALMLAGPTGMFFLAGLYLQNVLGFSVLELGLGFLPITVMVAFASLKVAPRLLREFDGKTLLIFTLPLMAAGLGLMARVPADGSYLVDVLPAMLLLGIGGGLSTPAALQMAFVDATESDRGLRSGLVNTSQQVGAALGLAIIAPVAAATTADSVAAGGGQAFALTEGYQAGFLVGFGILVLAVAAAIFLVQPETPKVAPQDLDEATTREGRREYDTTGTADADMVVLGLGGTGMMSMLWAVAQGRRAVGVDLRGAPFYFAMQWPLYDDLYHHLATIDRMMEERYGIEAIPTRTDGSRIRLHECFFRPDCSYGDSDRADEVLSEESELVVACPVRATHLIDDRVQHEERQLTIHPREQLREPFDPLAEPRPMAEVLAERPKFMCDANELLILMRRYLEGIEQMDLKRGIPPRVRLLTYHRTAEPSRVQRGLAALRRFGSHRSPEYGVVRLPDGRIQVRVEPIRELDSLRSYTRVRDPHGSVVDLGTPELLVVAEGAEGVDARRLGFQPRPVTVDHGGGPVPAEVDYVMGSQGLLVDGVCRRRIASVLDVHGQEHWVRQTVEGHDAFADVAWIFVEIPRGHRFDPVARGLVSRFTPTRSRSYRSAMRYLAREYFLENAARILEVEVSYLQRVFSIWGPRFMHVQVRLGENARVGANAVVAGDSFGNGTPLNGRGPTTGIVGHAYRVGRYWHDRDAGVSHEAAIEQLAAGIKEDTEAWIEASQPELAQPGRAQTVASAKELTRQRRVLEPRSYRDDWSRLNAHVGGIHAHRLPDPSPHRLPDPSPRRPDGIELPAPSLQS